MSRKNIFEILKNEINIDYEIYKIQSLCEEDAIEDEHYSYTLEDFINEYCLAKWKHRNRCIDCDDMRERLKITKFHIKNKLKDNQILIYLEYILNLIHLCNEFIKTNDTFDVSQSYTYLQENILEIANTLNVSVK